MSSYPKHVDDANPYRPPGTVSELPVQRLRRNGAERFQCPHCNVHTFRFWRLYWQPPWKPFECPTCQAMLKMAKPGIFRLSECVVTAPFLVLGLLWALEFYSNIPLLTAALLGAIFADYFVDKQVGFVDLEHPPYARNGQHPQQ